MIEATILKDSVSVTGSRITTVQATFHRFVLAEVNTHRALCLAGDSPLDFQLPDGRRWQITIEEFCDKWNNGHKPRKNKPPKEYDLSNLILGHVYTPRTLGEVLQPPVGKDTVNQWVRNYGLPTVQESPRLIAAEDVIAWQTERLQTEKTNRQPYSWRAQDMRIRSLDETTGKVITQAVKNVWSNGVADVYELETLSGRTARLTADHRVHTPEGYRRLAELSVGSEVTISARGKVESEMVGQRFAKVAGRYRSDWQEDVRRRLVGQGYKTCFAHDCYNAAVDIHHIIPVWLDPSKCFDEGNVTYLCESCHAEAHRKLPSPPLESLYLVGKSEPVVSLQYIGRMEVFDLEVDSEENQNFFTGGIAVHNCKSSASSRAIPVKRRIEDVLNNTAFPIHWGANQAGMQAGEELSDEAIQQCYGIWEQARDDAVRHVKELLDIGLHKQVANRLLEPFLWHTAIMTSTELGWENFFNQRCSPLAQPEIEASANAIKAAYDASIPKSRSTHTPYVSDEELEEWGKEVAVPVSVARSARVSYRTFEGNISPSADLELFDKLMSASPKHWAPTEHVAFDTQYFSDIKRGPFVGWTPLRHSVYMRPLLDLRDLEFEVSL